MDRNERAALEMKIHSDLVTLIDEGYTESDIQAIVDVALEEVFGKENEEGR